MSQSPFPSPAFPKAPLLFVRHGETHWNRQGRFQGRQDSPLTLNGINQIRAVGEALLPHVLAFHAPHMWCSPQPRARQTAGLLCERWMRPLESVIFDPDLCERNYGLWEGLTLTEIEERHTDDYRALRADPDAHRISGGGESLQDMAQRLSGWLARLPSDQPSIVVAHSGVGRVLRALHDGFGGAEVMALRDAQTTSFLFHDGQCTALPTPETVLKAFGCAGAGGTVLL